MFQVSNYFCSIQSFVLYTNMNRQSSLHIATCTEVAKFRKTPTQGRLQCFMVSMCLTLCTSFTEYSFTFPPNRENFIFCTQSKLNHFQQNICQIVSQRGHRNIYSERDFLNVGYTGEFHSHIPLIRPHTKVHNAP